MKSIVTLSTVALMACTTAAFASGHTNASDTASSMDNAAGDQINGTPPGLAREGNPGTGRAVTKGGNRNDPKADD